MDESKRDRWGHLHDEGYKLQVARAQRNLAAAASDTAIDHYAIAKLDTAAQAIAAARAALIAVDRFPDHEGA